MLSGKRHYCSERDTSRNKNVVKKLKIGYREKDSTPKKNVAKEQRNHFKEECDQAHGKTVFFGYKFFSVSHYNSERYPFDFHTQGPFLFHIVDFHT